MIIDFHTHIFPKAIRENRQKYFPHESAFKLLYDSPGSKLVGAAEIVASMDDQGVDKSVVFGFPWKTKETFQVQNDYIMEVVARYPDRLIGLCCFDPSHREAVPETEQVPARERGQGAAEKERFDDIIETGQASEEDLELISAPIQPAKEQASPEDKRPESLIRDVLEESEHKPRKRRGIRLRDTSSDSDDGLN